MSLEPRSGGRAARHRRTRRVALGILALALLAVAGVLPAQEVPADVVTTAVVPIVGSVDGVNQVLWRTRVELINETGAEAIIALRLPTAPDQPAIITSLPLGGSMVFNDVIGEAFGMTAVLSPLVIDTMGRRSVTVRAEAYPMRGAEAMRAQPIAVDYGGTFYPIRGLQSLSVNDTHRTNIGLVNLSEKPAPMSIAVQRLPGRLLGVAQLTLPPLSLSHVPIQILFPMITGGDNFTVIVQTPVVETYCYASVIENQTNNATYVRPSVGAPGW